MLSEHSYQVNNKSYKGADCNISPECATSYFTYNLCNFTSFVIFITNLRKPIYKTYNTQHIAIRAMPMRVSLSHSIIILSTTKYWIIHKSQSYYIFSLPLYLYQLQSYQPLQTGSYPMETPIFLLYSSESLMRSEAYLTNL